VTVNTCPFSGLTVVADGPPTEQKFFCGVCDCFGLTAKQVEDYNKRKEVP